MKLKDEKEEVKGIGKKVWEEKGAYWASKPKRSKSTR